MPHVPGQPTAPSATHRYAISYHLDGDQRFLSHQDELRALGKAIIRARWPLAYSQGYNPQPKLSIAMPRPLGVASACQLALVGVKPAEPNWHPEVDLLRKSLPTGFELEKLSGPLAKGTPLPQFAHYCVNNLPDNTQVFTTRINEILSQDSITLERDFGPGKPRRKVDIRPHLHAINCDGDTLHIVVQFIDAKAARPTEVLDVLGLDATRYRHHIRLTKVEWIQMPGLRDDAPLEEEGLTLATQEDNT